MSGHPYQPGTVWAPKPRRGAVRIVRDRPARTIVNKPAGAVNGWGDDGTVWYVSVKTHRPLQTSVQSFRRWAGERIE